MSGRSGYRKTSRVIEFRRLPHEMPDWELTFVLPASIPLDLVALVYTGVSVSRGGTITVVGKRKDWVLAKGVSVVHRACPRWSGTIRGRLLRAGVGGAVSLVVANSTSVSVVDGKAMRQLPLAFA